MHILPCGVSQWSPRLAPLLRIYLKFGLCHVTAKIIWGLVKTWRMRRVLRHVPHTHCPRHPLFGFLPAMIENSKHLHHWRDEISRGLPISKMVGPIWDPTFVGVFVRSPQGVKHFLKDEFDKYTKSDVNRDWFFNNFCKWFGGGIFVVKHGIGAEDGGKLWLQQRKIAAHIFSRSNFNTLMLNTFVAKANRLKNILQTGQRTDMQQHFFKFTMDSIMNIFFGEESDLLGGKSNVYGNAFDVVQRCVFEYCTTSFLFISIMSLFPWPFGGFDGVCARLHRYCSPLYQQLKQNMSILDKESEKIIAKCRVDPKLPNRIDLLALFMRAVDHEGLSARESSRYLRNTVLNMVFAGRDTTACVISWMFFILSTHSELQRRVQHEIDERLPAGMEPSLRLLHHTKMPVLHALVYETLRMYPPVPVDVKEAQCDDVFPDGSQVPMHAKVIFLPWAMGRDPEVYEEPEKVKLERWIPFQQPAPHEFPVFQAGPRLCLGMDMAIFEIKVLASILLQEFSFKIAEGEEDKVNYSRTVVISVCNSKNQDSHNLWLIPERR